MKKSTRGSIASVKVIKKISLGKDRSEAYFPELMNSAIEIPVRRSKR